MYSWQKFFIVTIISITRALITLQGLQLSNTDYTVCVRMERNFCGIQYTACPDTGAQW